MNKPVDKAIVFAVIKYCGNLSIPHYKNMLDFTQYLKTIINFKLLFTLKSKINNTWNKSKHWIHNVVKISGRRQRLQLCIR